MRAISLCLALLALVSCQRARQEAASTSGVAPRPGQARRATVAGSFYPADPDALRSEVRRHLAAGGPGAAGDPRAPVRMLLVPHAGYEFSGGIAGAAFRQLTPGFDRVVVIAANHSDEVDYAGISVDRATHYEVPSGKVQVAPVAAALLKRSGFVDVAAAHAAHVIEVELPFLHEVNGKPYELVPLVVGSITRQQARGFAADLAMLDDGRTVFVFSVDLSHYRGADEARGLDQSCLEALVRANADDVSRCETDGTQVLLLMTELAGRLALTPRLIAYANSGDVSGERSRVVGYGAVAFEQRLELTPDEGEALLVLARRALEARVLENRDLRVPKELTARFPRLAAMRSAFVTLKKAGELRGCIGSLSTTRALADEIVDNAVAAATEDSRFEPVTAEELDELSLSISVLDAPRPLPALAGAELASRLGASKPGVVLEVRGRRSTFLPEVWNDLPEPAEFLRELCRKQEASGDCWRDAGARFQTYEVQRFEEKATR